MGVVRGFFLCLSVVLCCVLLFFVVCGLFKLSGGFFVRFCVVFVRYGWVGE